ncbi:hypothetical protein [Streptomyces sp. NPDC059003]
MLCGRTTQESESGPEIATTPHVVIECYGVEPGEVSGWLRDAA